MKKGVVILVACITFFAIVFVALFGVAPSNIIPTVYIESVEILDMERNKINGNPRQLLLNFNPDVEKDGVKYMQYFLNADILPLDSTLRKVYYSAPEGSTEYVQITNHSNGALLIKECNDYPLDAPYANISITLSADDGGQAGVKDEIFLTVKYAEPIIFG
jgi:hypothetical protein